MFKEKEYLGKLDNQKEVEKLLEQYILRFERDPREEPELSRFHLFDAKGNASRSPSSRMSAFVRRLTTP